MKCLLLTLFFVAIGVPIASMLFYAVSLLISRCRAKDEPTVSESDNEFPSPDLVFILVARHPGKTIRKKLDNLFSLDYPKDRLYTIVALDGDGDGSAQIIEDYAQHTGRSDRVHCIEIPGHSGKIVAMNLATQWAKKQLVPTLDTERETLFAFTDGDAQLAPDAMTYMTARFADPRIGGVAGRLVFTDVVSQDESSEKAFGSAQQLYQTLDMGIKTIDGRRVTANHGGLYAIRCPLVHDVPDAVTDDLFNCLRVIRQGYDFILEPRAQALMQAPSRDAAHELQRRRRITTRSLNGLWLSRELFNPKRFGLYGTRLFINKVIRRLTPMFALLCILSTAGLAFYSSGFLVLFLVEATVWLGLMHYPILDSLATGTPSFVHRTIRTLYYFLLAQYGFFFGTIDYLRGRRVSTWEPREEQDG
jgi:biofilm PGA synthesis N-glycosyltransferase PgaC